MNENCASFPPLGGCYTRRPDRMNYFSDVRTEVWTPFEADDRDLIYGTGRTGGFHFTYYTRDLLVRRRSVSKGDLRRREARNPVRNGKYFIWVTGRESCFEIVEAD